MDDTGTLPRGVPGGGGASSSGTIVSALLSRSPFSIAETHAYTVREQDSSGAPISVTSALVKLPRTSSPADDVWTELWLCADAPTASTATDAVPCALPTARMPTRTCTVEPAVTVFRSQTTVRSSGDAVQAFGGDEAAARTARRLIGSRSVARVLSASAPLARTVNDAVPVPPPSQTCGSPSSSVSTGAVASTAMPNAAEGSASGACADAVTVPTAPNEPVTASRLTGRSSVAPASITPVVHSTVDADASEQVQVPGTTAGDPKPTPAGRLSVTVTPWAGRSPVFETLSGTLAGDPTATVAALWPEIARAAGRWTVNGIVTVSETRRPLGASSTASRPEVGTPVGADVSSSESGASARAGTAAGWQSAGSPRCRATSNRARRPP